MLRTKSALESLSVLTMTATESSQACSQVLALIFFRTSCSAPSKITPSRAQIVNSSGFRSTRSELSLLPSPWSGCHESASGLPMVLPGRWCKEKSNLDRNRDHRACLQLSFHAVWKYSRFLWFVQISEGYFASSRKCLYSSITQMTASIFLS